MTINIKYFGELAEITGKSEESIEVNDNIDSKLLIENIEKRFDFSKVDYKLAINKQISHNPIAIKSGDEIALLPPFAGG